MTSERLTPAELDAMLADLELGIITRNGSSMFPIYAAAFRELRRLPTMLMEQSTARLRRIHELEAERSMRAEAKCDCLRRLYRALGNWQPPEFSETARLKMALTDAIRGKFDRDSEPYADVEDSDG